MRKNPRRKHNINNISGSKNFNTTNIKQRNKKLKMSEKNREKSSNSSGNFSK
jgi:hypothetical protein